MPVSWTKCFAFRFGGGVDATAEQLASAGLVRANWVSDHTLFRAQYTTTPTQAYCDELMGNARGGKTHTYPSGSVPYSSNPACITLNLEGFYDTEEARLRAFTALRRARAGLRKPRTQHPSAPLGVYTLPEVDPRYWDGGSFPSSAYDLSDERLRFLDLLCPSFYYQSWFFNGGRDAADINEGWSNWLDAAMLVTDRPIWPFVQPQQTVNLGEGRAVTNEELSALATTLRAKLRPQDGVIVWGDWGSRCETFMGYVNA
jgi:hypothetical protein